MLWRKKSLQPARFLLSGAIATGSHWVVMAVLLIMDVTPPMATAAGALIGAIINYQLQRKLTFQSEVSHRYALLRYTGVCTLSWLANLAMFIFLYNFSHFTPIIAQAITTLMLAFISYYLYKAIVFNEQHSRSVY